MSLPPLARETMIAVETVLAERQVVLTQLREAGDDVQQAKLRAVLIRLTDRLHAHMAELETIVSPEGASANEGR
jgi:hypothetical protein